MQILFVAPAGQDVGLTTVSLSLVRALQRARLNVGFLKPISQDDAPVDRSTHFARQLLSGTIPDPISRARAESLLGASDQDSLMEDVVSLAQ
ncbi:AAA family ATPase, partial [Deinococcus pimensis]|uniref:AAA family ATPase n=1 Tax=Deinococcus pimensis TaxID=309888 RepID=UPI0005EAFB00